jgi:hypothetical protein
MTKAEQVRLTSWRSKLLQHVKAIQDGRFQIGNNRGFINGWVGPHSIYGRLLSVAD